MTSCKHLLRAGCSDFEQQWNDKLYSHRRDAPLRQRGETWLLGQDRVFSDAGTLLYLMARLSGVWAGAGHPVCLQAKHVDLPLRSEREGGRGL